MGRSRVTEPACWKVRVTATSSPLMSGFVRPLSTTIGCGPVRLTSEFAGRPTVPADNCTDEAALGAATLTSASLFDPLLKRERKTLADEPDGTTEPTGAPSTNASLIVIPLTTACAPVGAWWNSSVGALNPASHPAVAGIS